MSFQDLADGKVSWTTDEGEFSIDASGGESGGGLVVSGPQGETRFSASAGNLDNVPAWVHPYANAKETESSFAMSSDEAASGILIFRTDDSLDDAAAWYEKQLEGSGYEVTKNTLTSNGVKMILLVAENKAEGRTENVSCTVEEGVTQITLQYSGKP